MARATLETAIDLSKRQRVKMERRFPLNGNMNLLEWLGLKTKEEQEAVFGPVPEVSTQDYKD